MTQQARDLEVIARLRSRDRQALGGLYDRYSAVMLGIALKILRNESEAEEALQDAWVQVWNRCGSYDPHRGTVASWLLTVVRSRALDRYRRRASRDRVEAQAEAEPVDPPRNPQEITANAQLRETLREALGSLEPKHREVLEIAYFEGLSQTEIAERLGTPLGTVKYWTRQGLMTLKERMPKDEW